MKYQKLMLSEWRKYKPPTKPNHVLAFPVVLHNSFGDEPSPNQVSINLQTVTCSSVHSLRFSVAQEEHKPSLPQSIPFIRSSVSRGLYTPSSARAGCITSDIHVSANTSVQAIWGVAAGVKRIGVKWSISCVMRFVQRVASSRGSVGGEARGGPM